MKRFILFTLFSIFCLTISAQDFIWAKQIGGTWSERPQSITTDANGNIYITGSFSDTVDFDPGPGTAYLNTTNGMDDIFIQKLDANGNFIWVKQLGYYGTDQGRSIITDASGSVYVTGHFEYTVDFDPGVGTAELTSFGLNDIFILKLDVDGNFIWVKQMGGPDSESSRSTVLDADGNIYTTGYFYDTSDFDPGPGTANLTAVGADDIFVQKLDANGNFLWVKQMGG